MNEYSSGVIAARLNASQRSRVGVRMNRSATGGETCVKSFEWFNRLNTVLMLYKNKPFYVFYVMFLLLLFVCILSASEWILSRFTALYK